SPQMSRTHCSQPPMSTIVVTRRRLQRQASTLLMGRYFCVPWDTSDWQLWLSGYETRSLLRTTSRQRWHERMPCWRNLPETTSARHSGWRLRRPRRESRWRTWANSSPHGANSIIEGQYQVADREWRLASAALAAARLDRREAKPLRVSEAE